MIVAALLGGLTVMWLGFWSAGLPFPNGDDAFFSGAAIHLAKTGQLANPWIVGWMQWIPNVQTDRFFVQPPFPSHVLAAWIGLFDVSTPSMLGYACAVGAAGSGAAALLLLRLGTPRIGAILGALLVSAYVLHRGLRPEPLGIALLLGGQVLMLGQGRIARFAGAAAILASPLCHALLLTFAIPLLLLPFWAKRSLPDAVEHFALLVLAGCVVLFLFTLAIRAEFTAFLHDFVGHARLVTPKSGMRFVRFYEQLLVGWSFIPNLTVLGLTAVLFIREFVAAHGSRPMLVRILACYGVFLGLGIGLYAPFAATYAVSAAAFAALVWSAKATGIGRLAMLGPSIALVAMGGIEHGLEYSINRLATQPDTAAVLRYATDAKPDLVLFDSATLRYVFDFNPPAASADADWSWSPGRSARWWSPAAIEKRDLWVVHSRASLSHASPEPALQAPRIFGRQFGSVRVANHVMVIAGDALLPPQGGFPFRFAGSFRRP